VLQFGLFVQVLLFRLKRLTEQAGGLDGTGSGSWKDQQALPQ